MAAVLLATALVIAGVAALPSLCYQADDDCRSDPQHHTDLSCSCSCHVVALLPVIPADERLATSFDFAPGPYRSSPPVFLGNPEPPPRA